MTRIHGRALPRLGAALVAALLVALASAPAQASGQTRAAPTTLHMLVTLYGFVDNSPPGTDIAFPTIHQQAGGTGTFQDPVTFATDRKEFKPGTIVYVPKLVRYFVMEDDCAECDQDWEGHGPDGGPRFHHIDLWAGGQADSGQALLDCEDALTMDKGAVIIHPASNLRVDTTPLFNSQTQACFQP